LVVTGPDKAPPAFGSAASAVVFKLTKLASTSDEESGDAFAALVIIVVVIANPSFKLRCC
jgi:hypothetical protein